MNLNRSPSLSSAPRRMLAKDGHMIKLNTKRSETLGTFEDRRKKQIPLNGMPDRRKKKRMSGQHDEAWWLNVGYAEEIDYLSEDK